MRKGVCLRFPGMWTIVVTGMILLAAGTAHGQPGANRIIYTRQPTFRIPFETDGGDRRLQEVQLYVSEDQGQTWQKKDAVPPERHGFNFRADHDGLYGFAVRTVDYAGRANPTTVQGIRPQLEVYVDTQLPVVMLRAASAREGMVSVEWDIREDHLDLSSFVLEYHVPGGGEWIPLSVEPVASGQRSWSPSVSGPVDVRLRVRDLAKNEGEMTIRVTPGAAGARGANAAPEQDPGGLGSRTMPGKRWVNSKRISLNYEIKDEGPSGVQAVELWFTRDGKTWQKYSEDPGRKPPYTFEASDEGLYGFSLIVRSGVGLREREPRNGDAPQLWVEVDLTKPIVHWVKADVGRGSDSGWLTITWKATDRNFGREPITLSYAKELPGPWTQIAANVENTGQYRWQIPAGVPYRFFVRVEATDLAGNVGVLDTAEPAIVDLHQPKGVILGVEPAANRDATPPNKER
ncbi:MAG TPA: hypothetical protein VKU02_30095 [Gemmataceae bacterium]|nr:hypothetical protein [Gemmataceae bacterium]